MNIVGSLVESYMYSDMYNREYDKDGLDKVYVGGVPVENILPSIGKKYDSKEHDGKKYDSKKQDGKKYDSKEQDPVRL
jgi:hypothetical protein